jgi:hypothetical protein
MSVTFASRPVISSYIVRLLPLVVEIRQRQAAFFLGGCSSSSRPGRLVLLEVDLAVLGMPVPEG